MITDAAVRVKALEVMYDFAAKADGEKDYEDALVLMAVELLDEAVAFNDILEADMVENQAEGISDTDDIQPIWDEDVDEFNPFDDDDDEIWPESSNDVWDEDDEWDSEDDEDDWEPPRLSEIRNTELF